MNRSSVLLWTLSILFATEARSLDLDEGSSCPLFDGSTGVCRLLSTCGWLREKLESKTMSFSQIVTCGFNGFNPIVCCKDDPNQPVNPPNPPPTEVPISTKGPGSTVPDRFATKISDKCQEYSRIALPFSPNNIINGREAQLTEYPHMAALGYPKSDGGEGYDYDCGGTLISEQWVVTAAHCVTKKRPPTVVRMGNVLLDEDDVPPVDRAVTDKVRHPSYRPEIKQNDIALLKLDSPVPFSDYVRPACIRTDLADVSNTTELIIAGWGSILAKQHKRPPFLQQANVTIVPIATCNATLVKYNQLVDQPSLRNGLLDSQLCALDTTSAPDKIKDACVGDSGGPIFTSRPSGVHTIVGVVSFGVSCATNLPSIYTRIASYQGWIESVVWPN